MFLLRTLLCAASLVLVLAQRSPVRAPDIQQTDYVDTVRQISSSGPDELSSAHTEVTTYAPRPTTSLPQSLLRGFCESPRGKFAHPGDCSKYVDCWDGRVLEKQCPDNLVFSDLPGQFCDFIEYVDCGWRPLLSHGGAQLPEQVTAPTTPASVTTTPVLAYFKWSTSSSGQPLPSDAVVAGGIILNNLTGATDNSFYVGRALVDGHIIPCTLVPQVGCFSFWNSQIKLANTFEVLQSNAARWMSGMTNISDIPKNAIPTGLLNLQPEPLILYSGRSDLKNFIFPGYISEKNKFLTQTVSNITTSTVAEYQILVLVK